MKFTRSIASKCNLRGVVAAGAVMALATGCLALDDYGVWVNDDGAVSLPVDAVADQYPSRNTVVASDYNHVGSVLDSMTLTICGLTAPTGDGVNLVLSGPEGQLALLATGFAPTTPVNVAVVSPYTASLVVAAAHLPARAAARVRAGHPYAVPKARRAGLLRKLAKHSGSTYSAGRMRPAKATEDAWLAYNSCNAFSTPLYLISTADSDYTLPSPGPVGPYASDIGVFTGTDPRGVWRLWAASSPSSTTSSLRPALTVAPTPGAIDNWFLSIYSYTPADEGKPFNDDGEFTVTGDDTEASPLTFTMHVEHKDGKLVTPTGQVRFIECIDPLCDGDAVGTARLVPDEIGAATATLVLDPGSVPAGDHRYQAQYFGDDNFDTIVSDPVAVTLP